MAVFSYDSRINSEVGEVVFSPVGNSVFNLSFSYKSNPPQIVQTVDYYTINESANVVIDLGSLEFTYEYANYGFIDISYTDKVFKTIGSSQSSASYNNNVKVNINLYNYESKNNVIFTWVGNGTLFEIGGDITLIVAPGITGPPRHTNAYIGNANIDFSGEADTSKYYYGGTLPLITGPVTYNYNSTTVNAPYSTDYGRIYATTTNAFDYGAVSETAVNRIDYADDLVQSYKYPFGTVLLSSYTESHFVPSYNGSGTISIFKSGIEYNSSSPITIGEGTLFAFDSIGTYSLVIPAPSGFGLFGIFGKSENSHNYTYKAFTQTSVPDYKNYGDLNSYSISSDYGFVGDKALTPDQDYGLLEYPLRFGSYKFNSSTETTTPKNYVGSGLFSTISGSTQSKTNTIEIKPETSLFAIYGAAYTIQPRTNQIYTYTVSDVLYALGSANEAFVYKYYKTKPFSINSIDLGVISEYASTIDYGLVINVFTSAYDYEYLVDKSVGDGKNLTNIIGSSEPVIRTFGYTGIGKINTFKSASVTFTEPTPQTIPTEGFGLFTVTGSCGVRFNTTYPYTGSGFAYSNSESINSFSRRYIFVTSSEDLYTTLNLGSVNEFGSTIDYETIDTRATSGINYGLIVAESDLPYKGFRVISGSADSYYNHLYINSGSGTTRLFGGSAQTESIVVKQPETTDLFTISGSCSSNTTLVLTSAGINYVYGGSTNKYTHRYSGSSINTFSSVDLGDIITSGSSTNYGSIGDDSDQEINYDYIINTDYVYPYGKFIYSGACSEVRVLPSYNGSGSNKISGAATVTFTEPTLQIYVERDYGLYAINGSATTAYKTSYAYNGSGLIYKDSGCKFSVIYNYTLASTIAFSTENYGDIVSYGSTSDYGSISEFNIAAINYGYVIHTGQIRPYGSTSISGSGVTTKQNIYKQVGSGSLFTFKGSADFALPLLTTDTSTSLFGIQGNASVLFRGSYTTSGNIYVGNYEISQTPTSTETYSYNSSSVSVFSTSDAGTIITSGDTANYGSVIIGSDVGFDYGVIINTRTIYPYGLLNVTGSSTTKKSQVVVGSGILSTIGTATVSFVEPTPQIYVSVEYEFNSIYGKPAIIATGSASTIFYRRPSYIGSGSLFTISGSNSSVSFNYDFNSVNYFTTSDYGDVITSGSTTNYGFITAGSGSKIDSGYIINTTTEFPYRGCVSVSSSASVQFCRIPSYIGSGNLFAFSTKEQNRIDSVRTDTSTSLFSVYGSALTKQSPSFVGTGSLFEVGVVTNSTVYSYNSSSITIFSTDNYGLVSNIADTTLNYGTISVGSDVGIDYGSVIDTKNNYPYGTLSVNGSYNIAKRSFGHQTTGSINISGAATTAQAQPVPQIYIYRDTNLYTVSGISATAFVRITKGSGTLFTISNSSAAIAYNYNISSIKTFDSSDYGAITVSGTTVNYGAIGNLGDGFFSYGSIEDTTTYYPFGLLKFFGSAGIANLAGITYAGSGSISTIRGGASSAAFVTKQPETTDLFTISGSITEKYTSKYFGSGSILTVGGEANSASYSYNISSVGIYTIDDLGTITTYGSTVNYGSIIIGADIVLNYGSVKDIQNVYPYGSFVITSVTSSSKIAAYIGFGAKTLIKGSASSSVYTAKQPETTDLYAITGTATVFVRNAFTTTGSLFTASGSVTSAAYSYNTSSLTTLSTNDFGTITTSGSTVNYGSIVVGSDIGINYGYVIDSADNYPFGNLNLNGTHKNIRTFGFAGLGSANISGAAGIISTQPSVNIYIYPPYSTDIELIIEDDYIVEYDYEIGSITRDTNLYTISGAATINSAVSRYESSGSLFSVGGSASSITYAYTLNSLEYFSTLDLGTVNTTGTSSDYGSITVGHNAILDYGSVFVTQTDFPYKGKVFVTGVATTQKYNVYTQVGSGTLNVISGFANSIYEGKKTLESTDLFSISGTPYVTLANKFFGSGSLLTAEGSATTGTYNYNSSSITSYSTTDFGTITTSGSTVNYGSIVIGSDSEFNYGDITDREFKYPYGLFRISGNYQTSNRSFGHTTVGSISIFGSGTTSLVEPTPQIYTYPEYPTDVDLIIEDDYIVEYDYEILYGSTTRDTNLYVVSGSAASPRTFISRGIGSLFTLNSSAPSVTYNYRSVDIEYTSSINYGTVATTVNSIDNGLITNSVDLYTDYISITIGEKAIRFGSINTSGSSILLKTFTPVASGSLYSTKGAASSTFKPVDTDTVLFTISGSATNLLRTFGHTSSGSLFTIGDHTERVTYNYHIDSVNTYSALDYQTITSTGTSEDYGFIASSTNEVQPVDYGYINVSESVRAYQGSIRITGTTKITYIPLLIYTSTGGFKISGAVSTIGILTAKGRPESTDLYNVSGSADSSVTRPIFTETAKFSTFSGAAEATTKVYNQFSINEFSKIDYELITGSGSAIDYGLVFNSSNLIFNYGYIFNRETVLPYGNITIGAGAVDYKFVPNFAYTGTGSLFAYTGSADARSFSQGKDVETRLFNVSGSALTTAPKIYTSTGSLFNIGSKIESAAYAYNSSSINEFSSNDYEYITSIADTTLNYGLISESSVGDTDLGYIVNQNTLYPYGRFTFAGQSSIEFYRRPSYVGSGSLFAYRGSAEIRSFSQGKDADTQLFNVSGSANTPFSRPYIASGSLFNIGSKDERRTYVYDASSIVTFSASDYEYINSTASVYENYGLVSQSSIGNTDLGYITNTDITYPFGTLSLYGSSLTSNPRIHKGSGSLFAFSGVAQSSVKSTTTETSLFTISGTSSNIRRFGYAAAGSLFNIGSKIERAAYAYNQSSITEYSTNDYGYVSSIADTTTNCGLISESSVGDINFGEIRVNQNQYPFGSFAFYGAATQKFTRSGYITTGSLFAISGSAQATSKSFQTETSLFTISGASSNIRRFGYSGTGSLFDIGSTIESRTYAYNQSSILNYNTLNYEDIGEGATTFNNYGTITEGSSEYYNYGSVSDTDIVYPYGGFNISGGTEDKFEPILAWTGSGNINVSGSVYIVFNLSTKSEPTSDDTIKISGSSKSLFSLRHIGSGSVFNIGKKIEKAAYSYNTSSIVSYGTADYQFISSAADLTPDYGSVSESSVGLTDLGSIVNLDYVYPFGTLKVSNSVIQKATSIYRGSGSLFAIGGASNAYSRIASSETQLFVVSGNAETPRSKVFTGSGSLFTFRSLTESSAVNPPATGLFRISGIAKERATDSWLGTGSITLQTGIYPEYLYYRPTPRYVTVSGTSYISGSSTTAYISTYTNVGSGVIYNSGSALTPRTRPFIGAGTEFISGKLKESFSKGNYAGSGSLFTFNGLTESSTKVLASETRLYKTSGSAATTRSEVYRGTGSLFTTKGIAESFVRTVPSETQLFKVSGIAKILLANKFVGSGSLFTFKGATESTTIITSTETQLFKVSGIATTRYNAVYTSSVGGTEFISGAATQTRYVPKYTGFGSLFTFNGLTESSTRTLSSETRLFRISGSALTPRIRQFIGSGTEFISSNTATIKTTIYSGSGSLFTLKSATQSKTDVSTSTVLFKVSGTVGESFIRTTYFGSGKVSLLRGAAESSSVRVPPETQLFRIIGVSTQSTSKGNYTVSGSEFVSGLGTESTRKIYTGSGSLFTFKSATESSSFVPVSKITDIKIYGFATTTHTESYQATGSTFVYNSAHISRTYPTYNASGTEFISGAANQRAISSYQGKGNITEFGGSAQSTFTTIPPETLLYRISGTATTSFKTVYTATSSGQFTYKGNADLLRRQAFTGSGSLFAINSATIAQRVTLIVETNLFKISGGERNSYTRISIFEGGQINTSGKSTDEKVLFTPSRIFGTII
jgi:hypothetical protein